MHDITLVTQLEEQLHTIYSTIGSTLTEYVQKVFDEYADLDRLVYVGWTPGFNDGEPCEHSSVFYVNNTEEYLGEEFENNETYEANRKLEQEIFNKYNNLLAVVNEAIHRRYGTDYSVVFSRVDGEVKMKYDYYDCGY